MKNASDVVVETLGVLCPKGRKPDFRDESEEEISKESSMASSMET